MQLRDYQKKVYNGVRAAWLAGALNVLAVMPTGAGKTVTMSHLIHDNDGPSVAIAHRRELVGQISLALAREKVYHRVIGPRPVVRWCVKLQRKKLKACYYRADAPNAVAGVDSLISRQNELASWAQTVTLWVQDEAHHVLKGNKWGQAAEMFPQARGLGVTATPLRADGAGLGREFDGLFDQMVEGPNMRELINRGHLTDYAIYAPITHIDYSGVSISKKTGDWSKNKLTKAVRKSKIVGDVVKEYLKIAPGKLGITFATDIETAKDIAQSYNDHGVPAAVISSKSTDEERASIMDRFERRELIQLVNVDLFGEGFDLPVLEVVSMARPTESYGLYVQQFGRVLRTSPETGKTIGIIIDHVGNVARHGLPDKPVNWSLARRERKGAKKSEVSEVPITKCPECTRAYEQIYKKCPYCGYVAIPAGRSKPEFVDGDLHELDAETLARMRGEVDHINRSPEEVAAEMASKGVPHLGQLAAANRQKLQIKTQDELRSTIATWGGWKRFKGSSDSEIFRTFYHKFGTDILSAKALKTKEALGLDALIRSEIEKESLS